MLMLAARRTSPCFSCRTPLRRVSMRMFSRLPGVPRLRTQLATTFRHHRKASDVLVDEEIAPGYNWKAFYPAHPGEVLDSRYELKTKVGWGSSSTVWLAEDITRHFQPSTSPSKKFLSPPSSPRNIPVTLEVDYPASAA
jgi:hypothetical protein